METQVAPIWMLEFALALGLAKIIEALLVRARLPRVLGYVLAGLMLVSIGFRLSETMYAFAILGIVTMLFHAGLSSSTREFFRGLRLAGVIAIGGVVGALLAGFATIPLLGVSWITAFSIGVILSATSVSLTIKTLEELGRMASIESTAIIGAAVVDDVLGLALLSTAFGISGGVVRLEYVVGISALAFAFWLLVSYGFQAVSRPLLKFAVRTDVEAPLLTLSFILLMILSYTATYVNLSAILLAYALGLGLASYPFLAKRIFNEVKPIISLFTPLFFVYSGMLVDIHELMNVDLGKYLYTIIIVITLAIMSKLLGCYAAAKILGFDHYTSIIIGLGMMPRAEVMLTAAALTYQLGLITQDIYIGILLVLPLTTLTVPPLLKYFYSKKLYYY